MHRSSNAIIAGRPNASPWVGIGLVFTLIESVVGGDVLPSHEIWKEQGMPKNSASLRVSLSQDSITGIVTYEDLNRSSFPEVSSLLRSFWFFLNSCSRPKYS